MTDNVACRATSEIQDGGYETGRRIILRDINHLPVLCPPSWISGVARHVTLSVIVPLGSASLKTYSFHLEFRFYLKYQGTCINFRFHVRHLEFQVLRDMKYSRTQLHWVDHPKNNIYCKIIVVFIISAKQYMRNSCSWCNFWLRLAILFPVGGDIVVFNIFLIGEFLTFAMPKTAWNYVNPFSRYRGKIAWGEKFTPG